MLKRQISLSMDNKAVFCYLPLHAHAHSYTWVIRSCAYMCILNASKEHTHTCMQAHTYTHMAEKYIERTKSLYWFEKGKFYRLVLELKAGTEGLWWGAKEWEFNICALWLEH